MSSPGTLLQNRYQLLQRIGGGMGDVYLANDLRLGNQVVVKENRGVDPQLFYTEATILATLQHPNLPNVTDHWIEPASSTQYLVMSYVEGQTLEQIVQARRRLTEADARAWMFQVMDAVRYLHVNRIIHRDIKPQNIIITPDSRAILVDFGIAKVMATGRTTQPGVRGMGSPGYAPLEQYTGGTDERSDVYGLGATLYFALSGIEPPASPDRASGTPLPPLRASNSSVSPSTERTINQAMALIRNQRFQSIAAMEQALQGTSTARLTAVPRLFLGAGAGAVVLLVGILSVVLALVLINSPSPTPPYVIASGVTPTIVPLPIVPTLRPTDPISPPSTSTATTAPVVSTATATSMPSPTTTATPIPSPTRTATLRPTPEPPLGSERIVSGAPMVYVPSGEFTMGYNSGAASEQPAHPVFLNGFWIDKYEVSVKLYAACAGQGCPPTPPGPNWKSNYFNDFQNTNNPVINVTWVEASAYCAAVGKRLPTEAEWEKAARGTNARLYPWGNDWRAECAQYGWSPVKGHYQTYADVDGYSTFNCPGPYGLTNMAGNVWEWVADWYDANYYKNQVRDNPKGPPSGVFRIIRGGSVTDQPPDLRTTIRFPLTPDTRKDNVGFRCAQ